MLASNFLSVVIGDERDDSRIGSDSESSSECSEVTANINLYNELELPCKLPKALLSECTISLASPQNKGKEERKLRFEATMEPVKISSPDLIERDSEPTTLGIVEVLQGVQAVYSDDENYVAEALAESQVSSTSTKCGACGKVFFKGRSLMSHLKFQCLGTDDPSKGLTCQVCGKSYSQRSVLKKHAAVHTGYRQRCNECGIDFTQRSSLLRHCKRIHGLKNNAEVEKTSAVKQLFVCGKE